MDAGYNEGRRETVSPVSRRLTPEQRELVRWLARAMLERLDRQQAADVSVGEEPRRTGT
jgi:hypothetical protein